MPDLVFTNRGAAEAIRTQQQINEGARKLQGEYKESAREAAALERAAKRIYESQRSPQEAIIKKMGQIKKAQKEGLIPPKEASETLGRLKTKMTELETQSNKTFGGGAIDRMTVFAGGIAPIAAALKAVTDELKSQFELVDKAAQTQLSLVPSRQNLIDNLVGRSPEEIARTLAKSQTIALSRGVPEAFINNAIGSAVSATGGELEAAVAAVDFAARRFGDRPEKIAGAVGATLDVNDITRSTDPRVSAGLLAVIAKQSRLTKSEQIAENAPKALTALAGFGATREGGAAVFSTLSNAIKDSKGEVTKTASVALGKEIEKFGPKATGLGGVLFRQLPTLDSKIVALQESEELRNQFLANPLSVPGEAIIPIRNLLDPSSVVGQRFKQNRAAVPGTSGLISLAEESITNLRIDPNQPLATATRQISALTEDLRRQASPNLTPESREDLKEILQRTGRSNLGARAKLFLGQLSDSEIGISTQEASDILENEAIRLGRRKATFVGSAGVGAPGVVDTRAPTQQELDNAKLLQQVSDILERSVEIQKEQTELLKEGNRNTGEGGLIGGPS